MADDIDIKLSELGRATSLNQADLIYGAQNDGTTNTSVAITLDTLGSAINKEVVYTTKALGLAAVKEGQYFYVWTDSSQRAVYGYKRSVGTAVALLDSSGNPRTWTSNTAINALPGYYGYSQLGEVPNFAALRTLPVLFDGQRVKLRGWADGTVVGGGEFIGRFGTATDDGGMTASGSGYYWVRVMNSPVVTPFMFGAVGGSTTVDNTTAIINAVAAAKAYLSQIDFRGGPWRITKTVDLTGVFGIRTDVGGRFLVDPTNFTAAHTANYVVTFGNPDTAYGDSRAANASIVGTLQVNADNRNAALNGIYIKANLMTFNSVRAVGFNGSGVYLSATWDSKFDSISVESCGNLSSFAFQIAAGGDTSNCLFIGRIQAETAYHKQISINAIRSEFHTIHAERMYILSTNDGQAALPSGLTYVNSYFLLSNCILGQVVIDALASTTVGTVSTTPSVILNLYATSGAALAMGSSIVSSTYGLFGTISNSSFQEFHNTANPTVMENCNIANANANGVLRIIKGTIADSTIDTLTPYYGTDGILLENCTVNNDINFTAVPIKNILFVDCNIKGSIKQTDNPSSGGGTYAPVTFRDCRIATLAGYWQHYVVIIGGYIATVNLVDRAYVDMLNVRGGTFTYATQAAFVTNNCSFTTVTKWAIPAYNAWPVGKRTQRMGYPTAGQTALVAGAVMEYINTVDAGCNFQALYGGGFTKEVDAFATLRALTPVAEGEKVKLRSYLSGGTFGGGDFIGHLGTSTDNGGTVAAGSGFYWTRVINDGQVRASFFNLGSGSDETTKFMAFCALPYDKVQDQSVIVSGLGVMADGTDYRATGNSIITVSAAITDTTGSNQGQCLKAGNYSTISDVVIAGGVLGGGILVTNTTGVTLERCEIRYAQAIGIRCAYDTNTTISNCWVHHSKHGIQMWLSVRPKVDNCRVNNISGTGNNGGGIFTASALQATVSHCTVYDCADVGIDFEGGRDCVSYGNLVYRCAHGELTIFATGSQTELQNSGFVMGNLVHRDNVVRRYSYYYDATDTLVNNDLADVAGLMIYGTIEVTTQGSIDFVNNVVSVESATGTALQCFRSRTSDVAGNTKIRFLDNKFSTLSGQMGTLLDRQDLVFEGNDMEYISGTLTMTEIRDHRTVIFKGNRILVRTYDAWALANSYTTAAMVQYTDGKIYRANAAIPANTAWAVGTTGATWRLTTFLPVITGAVAVMFDTVSGTAVPPNGKVVIERNTFDGMDGIWINITQGAYATRMIDVAENVFNNGAGMATFPIQVSGGTIRYRNQEIALTLTHNQVIDFSTFTGLFYGRFSSARNEFLVSTGGSAGPLYRFFLRNNNSGNADAMTLAAIDAGGSANTGIGAASTMFATFSGTTIVAASNNSTTNRAMCRLHLDWFA